MNKYQEALSRLRDTDLYYSDDSKFHQDLDVLQELVDKETPVKPLAVKGLLVQGFKDKTVRYFCGNCKEYVTYIFGNHKYCSNCGQRIDWSEEE